MGRINASIYQWLHGKTFARDDDLYRHYSLVAILSYGIVVYLGFVPLYVREGLWPLGMICIASAIGMLIGILFVRRGRHYLAAGLLFSLWAIGTTIAGVLALGSETSFLFYFMLIFTLQCTTPYAKGATRAAIALLAVLAILFAVQAHRWFAPYYGTLRHPEALTLYNILAGLSGIGLQLFLVSTMRDITAETHTRRLHALGALSHSDPLTGLYDSHHAYEFFDNLRLGRSCESWCVAMLGIDGPAEASHAEEVLIAQVAGALRKSLRFSDLIVHWGQGRFLLVLHGATMQDSVTLLEHLRQQLAAQPFEAEGQPRHLTVTIGVTKLDLDDAQGSIDICNEKMMIGRQLGNDRVVC